MGGMRLQFWSFDIVFAIVIFSAAMTLIAFEWSSIEGQLSLGYSNNAQLMQLQAQTLGRSILYAGWPSDWEGAVNSSNSLTWGLISVGIGTGNGTRISAQKVAALSSMANADYPATKQLLGVSYNYYITLRGSELNVSIGLNPSRYGAVSVYSSYAYGHVGGAPVVVSAVVWTNTSYGGGA